MKYIKKYNWFILILIIFMCNKNVFGLEIEMEENYELNAKMILTFKDGKQSIGTEISFYNDSPNTVTNFTVYLKYSDAQDNFVSPHFKKNSTQKYWIFYIHEIVAPFESITKVFWEANRPNFLIEKPLVVQNLTMAFIEYAE